MSNCSGPGERRRRGFLSCGGSVITNDRVRRYRLLQQATDHFRPGRNIWLTAATFLDRASQIVRHSDLDLAAVG
jgi:hypothetical protein